MESELSEIQRNLFRWSRNGPWEIAWDLWTCRFGQRAGSHRTPDISFTKLSQDRILALIALAELPLSRQAMSATLRSR